MSNKYDDIINLPHYTSLNHPRMSMESRAAQFAPFAALTGYEDAVKETARLTNRKIELDDDEKNILDSKLNVISECIEGRPLVEVVYFVSDLKKEGGKYFTKRGFVKNIDNVNRMIIFDDKSKININDIIGIDGDIFNYKLD